ncbi:MAG: HEAT repeat domain-containing protein [Chloroflexi bacterium]|nr:HEAT repeat domain-containing protein [Chloroflexota bacterium]
MTTADGHPDAAEPLDGLRRVVAAIASGQVELEPQDLHAISRLRDGAGDVVREQLAALDAEGRFALIERLRQVGADVGGYDFTVVFASMATDDDASVRTVAVTGLGQCETAGATSSLLRVAMSIEEEDAVRREAVSALGEVAMRVELGWASSEDAGDVVQSLRAIAEDVSEEEELRASALSALAVASDDWVAALIEAAFDSDAAALHLGAVEAMGRNADESWLPVLESALVAEDDDERLAAVQAIGEIGSEEGTPMLLELFNDPSASEEVVRGAVAALGEIGSEEALEELEQLRTHPDPTVRETAQAALDSASWLDDVGDIGSRRDRESWGA